MARPASECATARIGPDQLSEDPAPICVGFREPCLLGDAAHILDGLLQRRVDRLTDEGEFVEFIIRTEPDAQTKAFASRAHALTSWSRR